MIDSWHVCVQYIVELVAHGSIHSNSKKKKNETAKRVNLETAKRDPETAKRNNP
jgi:hypothetical protein